MGHFLIGLIVIALGVALIYFSPRAVEFIGRIDRAERNLGGTRNAIVLFGVIVIVLGVLTMFGVLQANSPLTQE